MNSIKKVSVKDFGNAKYKTTANQIGNNNSIAVHEVKSVNDKVEDFYSGKDPIGNWSNEEPKTMDEMKDLIKIIRYLPLGFQLAIMARIIASPEKIIHEGSGWAAAGVRDEESPYSIQYNILHDIAESIRRKNGVEDYSYPYGSCAQAIATLIITLFDPNFPVNGPEDQYDYMEKNPDKYQEIKKVKYGEDWGELQPGDILMSEPDADNHMHVIMFVGYSEDGKPLFFEAATMRDGFSMYPIVSERTENDDVFERTYHVYRPTVTE